MKILHIIASVDPRTGGPIQGVVLSSQIWRAHGHERDILSLDPPTAPWVGACPVTTFAVGMKGPVHDWIRRRLPWARYAYTPGLKRWLTRNVSQYDAVVVNGLWNYASLGAWRALRGTATPFFVFPHGMLDPWFNEAYPLKAFFKTLYWRLFEHKTLRDARGVLFTCEEERRRAATSFRPYRAREAVVGYGARAAEGDPVAQRTSFAAAAPGLDGRNFILFVGRIHEKKGVDLLIGAFSRIATEFPDLDLVIAGPDTSGLRGRLEAIGAGQDFARRIHWPGMLVGDAKWGAFRSARFFVLPSHQENFGVAVAEALSLGVPVLVTDKVNIWREVEADGAGIVVPDDALGVEQGLRRMCALSPARSAAMAEAARACFAARYDLNANALNLLDLMRGMCADEGAPRLQQEGS